LSRSARRRLRILLVSHAPLVEELGGAQVSMHLAKGLEEEGHDVVLWSPDSDGGSPRMQWRRQRRVIASYAEANGPFDVVDLPAVSATRRLRRRSVVVARSIQPELLYLGAELAGDLSGPRSPRQAARLALGLLKAAAVVGGWRAAHLILTLGETERQWMRRRFPRWERKLATYVVAPSAADREALVRVRAQRAAPRGGPTRFLWLGRWSGHKGTARLVTYLRERLEAAGQDSFTLAGCGPAPLEQLSPAWLEGGRLAVLPSFSRAELPALLACHDAGLFTSDVEGWGLSLNEMLESGMPVYATGAGAVPDLEPYFPGQLLSFPPAAPGRPAHGPLPTAYLERFHWPAIAADYADRLSMVVP
jgi:glycosyltransferase involved in cell wall biosynthesis